MKVIITNYEEAGMEEEMKNNCEKLIEREIDEIPQGRQY
jgi:hypothetical protein